jgi:hypothetical protein
MALQTFGTNVTMSLSDINVELGESVTKMIDFLGAATSFSGILDTETTDGFGADAVEMREFYGKTFSAGAGTYGTRNAHTFFFAWTDSELIQAAQNTSPDSTATYYVDDYIDNSLTTGDDVFLTETGTSKLDGGDNFYLSTTANEIGQISSTGELSNVRSRTPDTPTISQNSVTDTTITINIQGNTQVTNTYRIYVGGVSNSTKTDHTKGALANTDVTATHTITGLSAEQIYQIKVRGENTFVNGSDSNTINVSTAQAPVAPSFSLFTATRSETVAGRIDLAWNVSAGTSPITSFLITRKLNSAAGPSDTSVTTTNDSSEAVEGLGTNANWHFYAQAVSDDGTGTANANATTRPSPTIDIFTANVGSSAGEIDIVYATTEADTVTLKEDNTTDGTYETTIINNTTPVDGSLTRTGLTGGNLHTYQLTATGAGSVVATDSATPTTSTSWTSIPADFNMHITDATFLEPDSLISGPLTATLTGTGGTTQVTCQQPTGNSELFVALSTSGDPGVDATINDVNPTISHSSGTLYMRFKLVEPVNSAPFGDPDGEDLTITFSNTGGTNTATDNTLQINAKIVEER